MFTFDKEQYMALFQQLMQVNLFGIDTALTPPFETFPLPSPDGGRTGDWPALDNVTDVVQAAIQDLPPLYRPAYGELLGAQLGSLLENFEYYNSPDNLETMTGAVYDHTDAEVRPQVRRFLAVISDLYGSFLSNEKRIGLNLPLIEKLPPLATFKYSGVNGPFTITAENVKKMIGSTVAVVGLPGTYRAHPILWGALGHETGGHDVLHADPSLLTELGQVVNQQLVDAGYDPAIGRLWQYWIDESASDAYGTLNLGPAFGLTLMALLGPLNAQGLGTDQPRLRTDSRADQRGNLDPHPTDALRPFLVAGVVEQFSNLAKSARDAYIAAIKDAAAFCTPAVYEITLRGYLPNEDRSRTPPDRSYRFDTMKAAAGLVGKIIATSQLQALGGHAVLDLETWDDADEQTTQQIVTGLQQGRSIAGMGDDAQVLAAANLVLFQDASLYNRVTELVNEALDASYKQDPCLGGASGS